MRIIEEEDGSAIVLSLQDALEMAEERGLDLVEVAPNQSPPVCKLLDYGRFKFVQKKRERETKKSQARNEPEPSKHSTDRIAFRKVVCARSLASNESKTRWRIVW